MRRFVILDHDYPEPHFDLMIEFDGRLRTWRLLGNPQSESSVRAEPLGDHRIEYLDYEGPLSRGRGRVVRWDAGAASIVIETENRVVFQLDGSRGRGTGLLQRIGESWFWSWSQLRD